MSSTVSLVIDHMMSESRERDSRMALAAMLGSAPTFDLACVGLSLKGLGAMTFEAIACLVKADIVFCYPATEGHLKLVQLLNRNVINVHDTQYTRGRDFEPAYEAIIEEVMKTLKGGQKVAYATQGSPAFHCGTAVSLHRAATREGFSSLMVSGISSLELLSAELLSEYDMLEIQVSSVTRLITNSSTVNPQLPCLLFDLHRYVLPGVRETVGPTARPKLSALADLLARIYPRTHDLLLMHITARGSCLKERTNLDEFASAVITFGRAATIFIPPVARTV